MRIPSVVSVVILLIVAAAAGHARIFHPAPLDNPSLPTLLPAPMLAVRTIPVNSPIDAAVSMETLRCELNSLALPVPSNPESDRRRFAF